MSDSVGQQSQQAPSSALKRFVVLVKSNTAVEGGAMPTEQDLATMTSFNDELVDSGAMLAADGLQSSDAGARITFTDGQTQVQRGPFPHPQTLVAGFWIIQAPSLEHAIDLMKRAPMGGDAVLEIRQIAGEEDLGAAFTPELREREERQRIRIEENARHGAA